MQVSLQGVYLGNGFRTEFRTTPSSGSAQTNKSHAAPMQIQSQSASVDETSVNSCDAKLAEN